MGAGPGAGPASVRPRTRSAGWVPAPRGPRRWLQAFLWSRGSCCGRRDASPARPAPGLRWLHLRPVLAVDATAPRTDTGLPRGDGRQVRGGDRGSGQRKGVKFEHGLWNRRLGFPDRERRDRDLGLSSRLDIGVWYPGRVYTASGRGPGSALAGTCALPPARQCSLGARSGPLGWCLRRATRSLTPRGRC